ncbi:MAG: DUF2971 domain-containing protein [Gammaproteobacteria bacterium]|nr:DUF2971 domain-containing protein [Gammaproteobacteria bacterium]
MSNPTGATESSSTILRRYTNLAATIHHLETKSITLLDPGSWDDRNDTFFLDRYKCRVNAKSVLALCFSKASQTYHHWKVFADRGDGICIEFRKEQLLKEIKGNDGYEFGEVSYKTIDEIRSYPPHTDDLPFLKRIPYRDEQEYRIVFVEMDEYAEFKQVNIGLDSIRRINLSPWMPKALAESVKRALKSIEGCENMEVYRSTLIENETWKKAAKF